jgi:hypothetical protein
VIDIDYFQVFSTLLAVVSFFLKLSVSRDKIKQRKEIKDSTKKPSKFDMIDILFTHIIEFIEKRRASNSNSIKLIKNNLAEFTRLTRLIEAIKRKYSPDLIGVVKVNGIEKLIIDLSEEDTLKNISKHFGKGLFKEANDELMLDEGLYIPSVVKYKGDDDFVAILHEQGVTQAYIIPFLELGLMSGYLIIGYTKLQETRMSETTFSALKKRINKVHINFRKT